MIILLLFNSVQFYVVCAVLAAAVIAFSVRPAMKGHAQTHLLAGVLCDFAEPDSAPGGPSLSIACNDDGSVSLTRMGLEGLTSAGAVSLAITKIGFDMTIEERIVSESGGTYVNTALFNLDFLARERYHIRYNSDSTGTFATFTLTNRPGIAFNRKLMH